MLSNWRISNAGLQNLTKNSSESHNSASFLRFDAENGASKFKFFNDSERKKLMTFDQALRKFVESDYNFVSLVNNVLLSNGNGAIFLECAPFSAANIDKKQFEFVIMPASVLDRNRIDIVPFFDKFTDSFKSSGKKVTVFQNLDRSSSLIVPCPVDHRGDLADPKTIRRDYDHLQYMTHLTSFINGPKHRSGEFHTSEAHNTQIASLWEALGREALRLSDAASRSKDEDKPYWISTDGRGVSWLHLRIDPSPKYYKFSEYKTHKREPPPTPPLKRTSSGLFQQPRTDDADETRSVRSVRGNAAAAAAVTAALPSVTALDVGDKVEANFQGKWYPGKITFNRSDGSYDILFEDGCTDRAIPSSRLRAKKISLQREEAEYKSNVYHHTTTASQQHELTPRALSQPYSKQASHATNSFLYHAETSQSPAHNGIPLQQQLQQNQYSFGFSGIGNNNHHKELQSNSQPGPFSSFPVSPITHQPALQHLPVRPAQHVVSIGSAFNSSGNRFSYLAAPSSTAAAGGDYIQQARPDSGRSAKPRSKSAPRYY